ncbi:MAG: DUF3352 domain-containing protein [Chloroflexota bacterium]|nr:DUF3352 domain-containing protein [Chloroflexota bacterium]
MKRLVIGVTGLLSTAGIVVLAAYLLIFSASADRAARAVPADAAVYLNIYLEPSAGQRMNLYGLIGRLPGFADPATLEEKIHDVAQRLIGQTGIDYAADLRPWLGDQVALAISPGEASDGGPQMLLLAAVAEPGASAAIDRIMTRDGITFAPETYRGVSVKVGASVSYGLLDDLLLVGSSASGVRSAIDAETGAAPSLADSAEFAGALRRVPADHLGSIYLDLRSLVGAGGMDQVGGYTTIAVALVAEAAGVRLVGEVPFAGSVPEAGEAFALARESSSLAEWMPDNAQAEAILFGLQQTMTALEQQIRGTTAMQDAAEALNQLRALAAIGLGINVDRDLLPLFDREAGIVLEDGGGQSMVQLLLRPSDPGAVSESLGRMRDALRDRGSRVTMSMFGGHEVTSIVVPEIGQVAYALADGVVVAAFERDAVIAVLRAHARGETLAGTDGYRDAFDLVGARSGHEVWVDVAGSIDALGEMLQFDEETRGILLQVGAFALSAPARDNHLEINAVLTVK